MRSTTNTTRPGNVPRRELRLDPYVVQGTTYTREELLRARGMTVTHRKRRATRPHPQAA